MKEKLALVIAALLITSMAFAISTTNVTAPSTFSASPGATLVEPDPARVRADTRVLIKVTVTNGLATDNIDNIRIAAPAGSGFSEGIGGAENAENLKLAADNMENAAPYLDQAGENLKLAENQKMEAGLKLIAAAAHTQDAASHATTWKPAVGGGLTSASTNLGTNAGENLAGAPENWAQVEVYLAAVGTGFGAAGVSIPAANSTQAENDAAEFLDNFVDNYLDDAATAIGGGSLRAAGENLILAAACLDNAGDNLYTMSGDPKLTGEDLILAAVDLDAAGDYLVAAADYDNNAGQNLQTVADYLNSVGSLVNSADSTDLATAATALQDAAAQIRDAGENGLSAVIDNVLRAGENLSSAADNLATAAENLGADLGGDELADAVTDENAAAENMRDVERVDLTTAGDKLIAAALDLSAAATTLETTANKLVPDTWTATEGTVDGAPYMQFNAILENVIIPGGSETFSFLWMTPNPGNIDNTYTITIYTNKQGGTGSHWVSEATATLTVDGKTPTLIIQVTQTGVVDWQGTEVKNLVGTELDNARATITITANEELQSIGTVYLENAGGENENLLPSIAGSAFSTTDNIVFTYQYITVENWDDNSIRVRVTSAKDIVGNENTVGMENTITVDTRAPIFADNSLPGLIAAMVKTNVTQAGTDTLFNYVDNNAVQDLTMDVADNVAHADNGKYVKSLTVDTTDANRSTPYNLWSLDLTMSEGLTSILIVTATDRTGNTVSDNIENIFIDTVQPTITFNTVAGETWNPTDTRISDNRPEIKITATDAGLGVARENLIVRLDNDDNFLNGFGPFLGWSALENKDTWVPSTGTFENVIENDLGGGLVDGTYYITVWASDNLIHPDNENGKVGGRGFTIDTVVPNILNTIDATSILDPETMAAIVSPTKKTTMLVKGTAAEARSTIYVYVDNVQVGSVTAGTDNRFQVEITLNEGTNVIYIKEVDLAGNESDKELFGAYIVDKTPPVIADLKVAEGEKTDKAVVTVSGKVTDAIAEYDEITVTIDSTGAYVAKTVYLNSDGTFSTSVPLIEGSNVINVIVMDTVGNQNIESLTVERTVTPWATYAIIVVIVALILAAIAIFRKR